MHAAGGASGAFDRSDALDRAARLAHRGDLDAAIREYTRLFEQNPRDLNVGNSLGDLYVRAGANDKAAAQFMRLAAQLAEDGFSAKARALYKKVLRLQPGHAGARQRIDALETEQAEHVSPFLRRVLETARASREAASPSAPASAAPPSPPVQRPNETRNETPGHAAPHEESVCAVQIAPPKSPPAADAGEWRSIDLSTATEPEPSSPPAFDDEIHALERSIEIAIDQGREADAASAQVRLAQACVKAGQYTRARHIVDDLLDRQPDAETHRELFERITARAAENGVSFPPRTPAEPVSVEPAEIVRVEPATVEHPVARALARAAAPAPVPVAAPPSGGHPQDELLTPWIDAERIFEDVRTAALDAAAERGDQRLAEAARLVDANELDKAAEALEEAMCTPRLRAAAGSRLAHILLDRGAPIEALALLEWVAEMPPSSEDGSHELAYDLGLTLEALGEQAQALGVYRELLAEVGPHYRDVAVRAERLAAA